MTEKVDVQKSSYLFEWYIVLFFGVLLLVAIWFSFLPLIIVTSFLLLLSIIIVVWKEQSLNKVDVAINPSKTRIFSGENFYINVAIKNDKWLPLVWLELDFPDNEFVRLGQKEESKYVLRFLWLMSYQHVHWKIKGRGLKRGVYRTGSMEIRSGDGFRFTEKKQSVQTNQSIYIYPELLPVTVPAFDPSMQWEVQGSEGGFLEDPLLVSGTREYEVGDSWKRLNVRATARTGKLQTNIYERIATKELFIYVNVRGFEINEEKYVDDLVKQQHYEEFMHDRFEFFLSIITSFVVDYHEKGIHIGYVSNAQNDFGEKQPFVLPTETLPAVLDHIALMTQKQIRHKTSPLKEAVLTNKIQAPLFIFCRTITKNDYEWYVQNKHKVSMQFYYVNRTDFSMKLGTVATPIENLLTKTVVSEG